MSRKKIAFITSLLMLLCAAAYTQDERATGRKLLVFYSSHCHRCIQAKNRILPEIEKRWQGKLQIEYLDTGDIENYKLLLALKEKHKAKIKNILPIFYFEGRFVSGEGRIKEDLEALLSPSVTGWQWEKQPLPAIDLWQRFQAMGPLAVLGAGLIDGINPCAFTVIVFFISFLALQGYKRIKLVVTGLVFVFTVFLTYLLVGLGIFGFLYQFSHFWLITKVFNTTLAIACFVLGTLALYDLYKFLKTGSPANLTLQLPQKIKNRIHSLIALHYRNTPSSPAVKRSSLSLAGSAVITGFAVSLLEALCTGQVYLPTIAFVLKSNRFNFKAWGYLVLYNLMFILPLLAVLLLALAGTTSEQFARFLRRNLLVVKMLLAILFFSLGAFLISGI